MKVTYVDHMGSDLSVVNAARVSFNKTSEWEYDKVLSEKDTKLIKYLASHNHWTPFGHTAITLHIKAPLFVARQLGKHQVGFVWNEVSRRYVDDEPEFYQPGAWRKKPDKSIKQGSGEDFPTGEEDGYFGDVDGYVVQVDLDASHQDVLFEAMRTYRFFLEEGMAPEQARMVLPQSMYTEWYWTGNLYGYSNVYNLRTDSHTQKETQEVAKQIGEILEPLYPVSWPLLTKTN